MTELTAAGKTPAIRFKGFGGAWVENHLGQLCDTFEYGLNAAAKVYDGKNKYIRITDINEASREFDLSDVTSPATDLSLADNYKLKYGDVLFARTGASVGKTYIYKKEDGKVYFAGFLIRARVKKTISPYFVFQNTLTDSYNKFIQVTSQRSGQPGVNAQEYSHYVLCTPNKKEQTQIGNFFQQLDRLIAQHQQKHEKLRCVKKALLTKMFPKQGETQPAIRFKGFSEAWEEKTLGDVSKIKTGSSNREDSGLDGKYTFFDRSEDIRTSNIFLFDCEAVIVAGEGSDFIPKYFVGKFDLHQRTYAVMNFIGCDGKYLFYYIHFFRKHFLDYAVGSTVKSLRLPMFEEMPIQVPKKVEQTKIGNLFQQLDTLISQQQSQLTKLNNIKQSMLAKMFV